MLDLKTVLSLDVTQFCFPNPGEDSSEGSGEVKMETDKSESDSSTSFKAVFKRLSLLRSGLQFQLSDEERTEGEENFYTVTVDVDGVIFTGTGTSKRAAKVNAAEQVVCHLEELGVKPRPESTTPAGQIAGEKSEKSHAGKNPLELLHEIVHNFQSRVVSEEHAGPNRKVTMEVTVDQKGFVGTARSNKVAKAKAAAEALTKLYGLQFTDNGEGKYRI